MQPTDTRGEHDIAAREGALKILDRRNLKRKVAIVVGTRPSLVKMSPIIRELKRRGADFFVIHTGQHYSYELDRAFFLDLELPEPAHRLDTVRGCRLHGEQTAEMLRGIERVLLQERPAAVVVGGDANSNLSGALAARKLNIQLCHDESGLRSYDWLMPEEHNRVMIDHIAEFLFAPNETARKTLEAERVRGKIFVTGTTIVDAVVQNRDLALRKSTIRQRLGLADGAYALMTVHHEENTDYRDNLAGIIEGANRVARRLGLPVVLPAHPRTKQRLETFGLSSCVSGPQILLTEPVGYLDFLALLAGASLVLTDSGGVTQESCILHIPCLTINRVTEWREVVEVGANLICGSDPDLIETGALRMSQVAHVWPDPFGGPGPAERIVDILLNEVLAKGYLPPRPRIPAGSPE